MADERFTLFWNGPFSQWEPSTFVVAGLRFTHAEQFMMHGKAMLFGDRDRATRILATATPKEMKVLGREVTGFDSAVWDVFCEGIVYTGNHAKFSQNPELLTALFATRGTTLVEASPYDRVWGIGLPEDDPRARDRAQWQGQNRLGKVLTRVREALLWEVGPRA